MISSLEIKNYKCFDHLNLEFGALTLLTGYNGGGKSSSTQPLFLLSQALTRSENPTTLMLNGDLVNLGTVGDVLPSNNSSSEVLFKITDPIQELQFHLNARAGDRFFQVVSIEHNEVINSRALNTSDIPLKESLKSLSFVSAVRAGTPDNYPIPNLEIHSIGDVGNEGQFAPYWYEKLADEEIAPERCHPSEPINTFRKQFDAWLGMLFPEAQANVQLFPQMSLLNLQFRLSGIGDWRRPANLGYGFSYVFPILVSLLSMQRGQIVIIDSPEAHLHPFAQSQMGRILAKFASCGIQIIIETHSDHLLNGSRIAVKDRLLNPDQLRIYFFKGANSNNHGVHSPSIDLNGTLSDWPEGFFDQAEKDLSHLAGW